MSKRRGDGKGGAPPPAMASVPASTASASTAPVVVDSRFAAMHNNPRFARAPRRAAPAAVDSRFEAVDKDPRFSDVTTLGKRSRALKAACGGAPGAAPEGKPAARGPRHVRLGGGEAMEVAGAGTTAGSAAGARAAAAASAIDGAEGIALGEPSDDDSASGDAPRSAAERRAHAAAARRAETVDQRLARLARMSRGDATAADDDLASEASDSSDDDGDDAGDARGAAEDDVVDPTAPDLTPAYLPGACSGAGLAV